MKALRSRFVHSLPPLAGLLSALVGGLVLIGWATESTQLTFHNVLVLPIACAGTLSVHLGRGVMAVVNRDQSGGYTLRRLLPGVFLIVPAIGG